MKKSFPPKNRRPGGSSSHAFSDKTDRRKAPFSSPFHGKRRDEGDERPRSKGSFGDSGSRSGGKPFFGKRDGDERPSFGDKKPFRGKKPGGRSFGDSGSRSGGDRKPFFGKRDGEERPFFGEKKPFRGKSSHGRDFEKRDHAERTSFGEDKPFRFKKHHDHDDRHDQDRHEHREHREHREHNEHREDRGFRERHPSHHRDRDEHNAGDRYKGEHRKKDFGHHDRGSKPRFEKRPFEKSFDKPKAKPSPDFPPVRGAYLWGLHAVREAWLNPTRRCYRLLATEGGLAAMEEAFAAAREKGLTRPDVKQVERDVLDRLLPEGSVHQGVILDANLLPEIGMHDLLTEGAEPSLVIVLDQVTDPHNVGAILRSAAAFGAGAVIVTERNAPQTTGVMAKVACGALEHVSLIPVTNLARTLEALGQAGYWRVGLAEEGEADLAAQKIGTGKTALVLGAEGSGLRRLTRENCDALARLPTMPPIGSLNVSNAAAVALYEVSRQKAATK